MKTLLKVWIPPFLVSSVGMFIIVLFLGLQLGIYALGFGGLFYAIDFILGTSLCTWGIVLYSSVALLIISILAGW